jgi:hypothetical protein
MVASRKKTTAPTRRSKQALRQATRTKRPQVDVRIRTCERCIMELSDELRHRTEDIIRLAARVAKLEQHNQHEHSHTAIVTMQPEASGPEDAPEPSPELPAGWLGD